MSEDAPTPAPTPQDPDALRAEIESTREELARTVDALGAKLDVKGRAADKVGDARAKVDEAKAKVGEAAEHALHAAPAPVADAIGKAAPPVHSAVEATRPYRTQLALGAVAVAVVALVVRRRRS